MLLLLISYLGHTLSLSLDEAFRLTKINIETQKIAQAKSDEANAKIYQAQATFYPSVEIDASAQQQDTKGELAKKNPLFGGRQSYLRFSATHNVFQGGKDFFNNKLQESNKKASICSIKLDQKNNQLTVLSSFFNGLQIQAGLQTLQTMLNICSKKTKEISKEVHLGKYRSSDLYAVQGECATFSAQKEDLELQWSVEKENLKYLTGIQEEDIQLIEAHTLALKKLNEYTQKIEQTSDVQVASYQKEATEYNKKMNQASYYPSVAWIGNYYLYRTGTQQGNLWDIGINLTIPIFNGFLTPYLIKEAIGLEKEAELNLQMTRRKLLTQIRQEYTKAILLEKQKNIYFQALSWNQKAYDKLSTLYRRGQSTYLEVISALNNLSNSQKLFDQIKFLHQQSLYTLDQLTEMNL